jgi:hypothetical protein
VRGRADQDRSNFMIRLKKGTGLDESPVGSRAVLRE